jgi:small subunit ribosomal protein S1
MSEEMKVDLVEEVVEEKTPSMDEFKEEVNNSLKSIFEGDIVKGTVVGVSDTEVNIDLGSYVQGNVQIGELSNNPDFLIKEDIQVGEEITAVVLKEEDSQGNIMLSIKQAQSILIWDVLKEDMQNQTKRTVKLSQAVKGGLITYIEGIRGFIPASQLSTRYVEDLETWVGKEIEVVIITAEKENNKLVLSGKEVEKEKEAVNRDSKMAMLKKGTIMTGTVDKIMTFGCFVNLGDGLSGLVHISQICGRRIKSPSEVVKEGQEVKVQIIDIKEGKISLSMKALEENAAVMDYVGRGPSEFSSGEEASTGLGDLLAGIKID